MPLRAWLALPSMTMDATLFQELSFWQIAVLGMFLFALLLQLFFYLFFYLRLAMHRPEERLADTPVSVIICAWNEEDNLKEHLQAVLEQDHPEFEVIVVNDHSTDETDLLLHSWQSAYPHLRVIELNRENARLRGKKFAVSMGVKGAKYDQLVFTDADCTPTSPRWLRLMAAGFEDGKKVVLGFGGFESRKGLFGRLYRYEGVITATQYLSYALAGIPYMGVGRNLAYQKEMFFRTKGFIRHRHIASGDDDLLVNEVANAQNTAIVVHPDAHTVSATPDGWVDWWRQKRRHLTTGGFYSLRTKVVLGISSFSHLFFHLMFFVVLSMDTMYWFALCGMFVRWLVHLSIMRGVLRILGQPDLLLFSLLGDVVSPILNTSIAVANRIKPPTRWR